MKPFPFPYMFKCAVCAQRSAYNDKKQAAKKGYACLACGFKNTALSRKR